VGNKHTRPPSVKVLPLPSCFHWSTPFEMGLKPSERKPSIGRDGWYYDRATKKSWYEHNGVRYEGRSGDALQFLYVLNTVYGEPVFTVEQLRALDFLIGQSIIRRGDPLYKARIRQTHQQGLWDIRRRVEEVRDRVLRKAREKA
jgi:hypothetical protein